MNVATGQAVRREDASVERKSRDAQLEAAAQALADLDALIAALLESTRPDTPWRRTLRSQLEDVRLKLQVLRLMISLDRPATDQQGLVIELDQMLSRSATQVLRSRADGVTKAALGLATSLSDRLRRSLCLAESLAP